MGIIFLHTGQALRTEDVGPTDARCMTRANRARIVRVAAQLAEIPLDRLPSNDRREQPAALGRGISGPRQYGQAGAGSGVEDRLAIDAVGAVEVGEVARLTKTVNT